MAASLYLIYGTDEYLVAEAARKAIDALVPPAARATQLEVIDGAVDTVDAATACLQACHAGIQSPGLFAAERTVWLRAATFFADNRTGRSETVLEAVAGLTERIKRGLPPGMTLLITAPEIDKRRAFFKACSAAGEVQAFMLAEKGHQAAREAAAKLETLAEQAGLRMPASVQQAFLDRVGIDTRQLVAELEKLAVYLGDRTTATVEDVAAICSTTRETAAWDLADAFGARDLPQALRVLRRLLFERQSPMGLMIGLENRIRELLVYREGLEQRWLIRKGGYRGDSFAWDVLPPAVEERFSGQMTRDPRANHPFRIGILAQQAARYTRRELHRSLTLAIEAHERMVSSHETAESILERFLTRALSGA